MKQFSAAMIIVIALSGCTAHKTQYIPFRPPQGYANNQVVSGVSVAGEAYPDKKSARKAFGFDIKGAGLLPVMLVLDNKSGRAVEIVAGQTFLVDAAGNYWPVVPNNTAFDRLEQSSQLAGYFGRGAGRGAVVGAAAGGLLATAIGIVSGRNVGSYLGKGAAVGAAGGAVIGGSQEAGSREREFRISEDLRQKGLEGRLIPDQHLANGFLFFPGEAESARELVLQWREVEGGALRKVTLPLPAPR